MRLPTLVARLALACSPAYVYASQATPDQAKSAARPSASDTERASVTIVAFDEETGRFLGPPTVVAFESEDHKNFAARFSSGTGEDIPYGTYRVEAGLIAHISAIRFVLVNQPRVTLVVGLPVSPIESAPYPSIRGRVSGVLPFKRSFIKLVGIYSGQVLESAIGANGTFAFDGVRCCSYMLLVIADGGIVRSKEVVISESTLSRPIKVSFGTPQVEVEIDRVIAAVP